MRTTLEIDDDVLATAKELARRDRSSAGAVLSRLARQALVGSTETGAPSQSRRSKPVCGFVPFAGTGVVISNDLVNALREAEGI